MKGHVRERPPGSGNWWAVIEARDLATNKRKRKWLKLKAVGKRQAQTECARIVAESAAGIRIEPDKITVRDFFTRWLESIAPNVTPRTHERYAEIVEKNLLPAPVTDKEAFGVMMLAKVQPHHISALYARAAKSGRRDGTGGLSSRTIHHMHRLVFSAFAWGMRMRLAVTNPAALLDRKDRPKIERKAMAVYDVPQTAAALESARGSRIFVPLVLAVLCGLRRGEIVALRWRNVDLATGTLAIVESAEQTTGGVRIKETKSGRGRNVVLPALAVDELKAWRLEQAQEFLRLGIRPDGDTTVITQVDAKPLQPRSLTHAWADFVKAKRLPRCRLHDLRHAHATHLLAAGVHPKIASERLGHSKIGITMDLYSHAMPSLQDEAAAKVDAALRAAQKR